MGKNFNNIQSEADLTEAVEEALTRTQSIVVIKVLTAEDCALVFDCLCYYLEKYSDDKIRRLKVLFSA